MHLVRRGGEAELLFSSTIVNRFMDNVEYHLYNRLSPRIVVSCIENINIMYTSFLLVQVDIIKHLY